jgi:hypothetical protein
MLSVQLGLGRGVRKGDSELAGSRTRESRGVVELWGCGIEELWSVPAGRGKGAMTLCARRSAFGARRSAFGVQGPGSGVRRLAVLALSKGCV